MTVALTVLQEAERRTLELELQQLYRQRDRAKVPPAGPPNHGLATPHWLREQARVMPILDREIARIEGMLA